MCWSCWKIAQEVVGGILKDEVVFNCFQWPPQKEASRCRTCKVSLCQRVGAWLLHSSKEFEITCRNSWKTLSQQTIWKQRLKCKGWSALQTCTRRTPVGWGTVRLSPAIRLCSCSMFFLYNEYNIMCMLYNSSYNSKCHYNIFHVILHITCMLLLLDLACIYNSVQCHYNI